MHAASLNRDRLGELIDLISSIGFGAKDKAKDVLGQIYEYFLGQFANAEGKKGGQFYTPASVVKAAVGRVSPQGRNPTSSVQNHSNVGLRDEAVNPTYADYTPASVVKAAVGRVSPQGRNPTSSVQNHSNVGLRDEAVNPTYADEPGFCASVKLSTIAEHGYVLTPGRYVGAEEVEDDDEVFADKLAMLTSKLSEQMAKGIELDKLIRTKLASLGYAI